MRVLSNSAPRMDRRWGRNRAEALLTRPPLLPSLSFFVFIVRRVRNEKYGGARSAFLFAPLLSVTTVTLFPHLDPLTMEVYPKIV